MGREYEISGVVMGTLNHSTSYCKEYDGSWSLYNDSRVTRNILETKPLNPPQNVTLAFYRAKCSL